MRRSTSSGFDHQASILQDNTPGSSDDGFGMGDALGQLGINWKAVMDKISPDEVAVFSGTAMVNLILTVLELMQSRIKGSRPAQKILH